MSLSRRMKKAAFRANMKAAANKNSVNNTHINEEPELGQEDSFLANMLGMISHSPFMKKVLLNAVGLTLMATSAGYGAVTAAAGTQTRVDYDGNKYYITTHSDQIRGTTALNAFKEFSVEAGKIANIYYQNGVSNIVNFVGPRINIQGVVNTIRNTGTYLAPDGNQVGGRLFFLSSNGMVLGTAGVVNTGSFYAIVPNATYMQQFLTGDLSNPTGATTGVKEFNYAPGQTFIDQINNITGGLIINGYNDNGANNGITLNSAGSIQIQGKINANNIGLYARNTTNYGISITGVDEYDKAELKTYKQTNFASIVNTTNNASTYVVDTATFAENDGEIRIVALGKGDSVVTGINSSNAEIKTAANGSVTILSEGKANLGAIAGNGVTIEANKGIELDGIQAYNDSSIKVKNTGASTLGNINLNKNGGAAGDIIVKGDIKGSKNAVIEIINDAAASDGNGSIQLGKAIGNNEFKNSTLYGKSVTLTAKNNIIDAYSSDTKNQITANDQINITATNGNISITNMEYKTNDTNKANLTVTATGGSATLKNLVGRKVSVTAKKGIDINGVESWVKNDDTGNAINIVNEGAGATGDITLKGIIKADGNANGTFDINIENKATASSENNGNIYLGEVTLSEDDLVYASLSGKNITIKATNAIVDRDHGQTDTKNKIKSTEVGSGVWNGISLTATNGDLTITNTQFLKSDVEGKTYAQLALATGGKATLNDLVGKTVSVTAKKGIEVNNVQSTRLADGNVN